MLSSLLSASIVLVASSAGHASPYLIPSDVSPEEASLDKLAKLTPSFKQAEEFSSDQMPVTGPGAYNINSDRGFRGFGGHSSKDKRFGDKTVCYINSFCHSTSLEPDPVLCPAGQQLNQTMSGCVDCPKGTYSEKASADNPYRRCSHCPSGMEPNKTKGATTCVPCGEQKYSVSGTSCKVCNGFVVTRATTDEEKKSFGVKDLVRSSCAICSKYQYFTGVGGSTADGTSLGPDPDYDKANPSTQVCASGETWCDKHGLGDDCVRQVIINESKHATEVCPFGTTADKIRNTCVKQTCDGGYTLDKYGDCHACENEDEYTIGNQSECKTCEGYGQTHAFNETRTNCVRCFPPEEPVLGENGYYICDRPFSDDYYDDSNCDANKQWVIDETLDSVKDARCTKTVNGKTFQPNLYPIRRCSGERGGHIQGPKNLEQTAWIGPNVISCMNAEVGGSANLQAASAAAGYTFTKSIVKNARISGTPKFYEDAKSLINIQGGTITGGEFKSNITITGNPTIKGGIFTNVEIIGNAIFVGPSTVTGTIKGGEYRNEGATGALNIVNASNITKGIFIAEVGSNVGALTIGTTSSSPTISIAKVFRACGTSTSYPVNYCVEKLSNSSASCSNPCRTNSSARNNTLNLLGGTFSGSASAIEITDSSSSLKISGGTFNSDKLSITGGTISGGTFSDSVSVSGGTISGGTFKGSVKVSGGEIAGSSQIYDSAQITGGTVKGGTVYGNAKVFAGNIQENSNISDNALICGVKACPAGYSEDFYIGGLFGCIQSNPKNLPCAQKGEKVSFIFLYKYNCVYADKEIFSKADGCSVSVKNAKISGKVNLYGSVQVTGGSISGNSVVTSGSFKAGSMSGGKFYGGTFDGAVMTGGTIAGNNGSSGLLVQGKISGGELGGNVFLGPNASISGGTITNNIRIYDKASVSGGTISGSAKIYGNASVTAGKISGNAQIYGNAEILSVSGKTVEVDLYKYDGCTGSATMDNADNVFYTTCSDFKSSLTKSESESSKCPNKTYSFSPTIEGDVKIGGGKIYGGKISGTAEICKNNPSCNVKITNRRNIYVTSPDTSVSCSSSCWKDSASNNCCTNSCSCSLTSSSECEGYFYEYALSSGSIDEGDSLGKTGGTYERTGGWFWGKCEEITPPSIIRDGVVCGRTTNSYLSNFFGCYWSNYVSGNCILP